MKTYLLAFLSLISTQQVLSQSTLITPGGSDFDNKSISSNVTFPSLTHSQILQISLPKKGTLVYDTTSKCIRQFDGLEWKCLISTNDNGEIHCGDCNNAFVANTSYITGIDLTVDSTGVFVVYTTFQNPITIEGSSYIKKFDTLTNVVFESNIINTVADPQLTARRIYTTQSAIYTLFTYCGEITLSNGISVNPIGGASDGLLIKHDRNGNIKWFKIFGGSQIDLPIDLTFDVNENIYVTGQTNSPSFTFDSYTFLNTDSNIFLLKLDSSGVSLGLDKIVGNAETSPVEIEWNQHQNKLYISGNFDSSISINGIDSLGIGLSSAFLIRMGLNFNIDSIIIQNAQDSSDFIKSRGFTFFNNGLEIQQSFDKSGQKLYFGVIAAKTRSFVVTSHINNIGFPYNHSEVYHRGSSFYRNGIMTISAKNDIKVNNSSLRNHSKRSSILLNFDSKSNYLWSKIEGGENTSCSVGTVYNGNVFALFGGIHDFSLCGNFYRGIQEQNPITPFVYDLSRISIIGLLKTP